MSIRETFCNSMNFAVINKHDKRDVMYFEISSRTFTMFLMKRSSKTGLFRHLSNHVLRVRNFGNTKAVRLIVFFKMFKINLDFKNAAKNWEKIFCFWDNCIWIGIVKLSLLRTGYFSSAANVWTSSLKIFQVNKRDLFQLNWLDSDHWKW